MRWTEEYNQTREKKWEKEELSAFCRWPKGYPHTAPVLNRGRGRRRTKYHLTSTHVPQNLDDAILDLRQRQLAQQHQLLDHLQITRVEAERQRQVEERQLQQQRVVEQLEVVVTCSQSSNKPRLSFGMKFLCNISMILMLLINVLDLLEVSNHLHLIALKLTYYLEWLSIWWNYSSIWRGFSSDFTCGTQRNTSTSGSSISLQRKFMGIYQVLASQTKYVLGSLWS